jgi:hypothetical protein
MPNQSHKITVFAVLNNANIGKLGVLFFAKDTGDMQCQSTDNFPQIKTIT